MPQYRWLLVGAWCVLALAGLQVRAWAADVYTIDLNSSKSRFNNSHVMSLLKAALEASSSRYGAYELKVSSLHMERERLLQEMLKGESVNLSGQVTSAE